MCECIHAKHQTLTAVSNEQEDCVIQGINTSLAAAHGLYFCYIHEDKTSLYMTKQHTLILTSEQGHYVGFNMF